MKMQLKIIQDTLSFISKNGYETNHDKFLKSTSKFLAELFNVNYVLIDKYSLKKPTIAETVAFYSKGIFRENIGYKLAYTPCDTIINKKFCSYPTNVSNIFPKDDFLTRMNIDSYIGIPLWSSNKEPIGLIALMDDKPINEVENIEIALGIIAIKIEEVLEKTFIRDILYRKVEELKSLKEIAEESEQKLKEAQQIAHLGHWELNILNNKLTWSDEVYRIFELQPQQPEASEDLFMKLVHPDDISKLEEVYFNAFKNRTPYEIKYRLLFKSGKIKYILGTGFTEYNHKEEPIFSIGTILDITSQIKTEEDIKKAKEKAEGNENKFKKLANLIFDGIIISEDFVVKECNNVFLKMFGYSQKEIIGKNILILLFHEKYHEIIKENGLQTHTRPYEIEGIRKDGTIFPVEIEGRNIDLGNENFTRLVTFRDITERKNTRIENKKLSTAIEQSANTIIITDVHGNIEYTNPKFTELTGYTAVQAMGKNPKILNSGTQSKAYYAQMWQTITSGKIWKGEFQNKAKNGNFFWEKVTISPIKNDFGEIINYLAIKEDVTKNKLAEENLRQANEEIEKSEKKFRELFEKSGDAILIIKNGVFVECNKATLDMLGYKKYEDVLNLQPSELSPEFQPDGINSFEKSEKLINIALENGTHRFDWWHIKSNGENFPAEVLLTTIENETNNKTIHCVWRDITDRKQDEQELLKQNKEYRILSDDYLTQNTALKQLSNELSEKNRLILESNDRFINLFEQNPVPLWEQDFSGIIKLLNLKKAETKDLKIYLDENPDFVGECISNIKILNVNKVARELFGVKNVEELKIHLGKTNTKRALEVLKNEFVSIGANKKAFSDETELVGKDNSIISAIIKSVIIDDYGKSIASVIDITEAKNAEKKLKEIQYLLLESQKIANIGSYELDFSNGIWKSSPALNDIFGIDEEYIRNIEGWTGLVHQEDRAMMEQHFEKNIIKNKESFKKEYRITRNIDKQDRWVLGMGKLEFDNQGNLKRLIGTIQDISEKRKILQEIINAKEKAEESGRLKTEFIQNMSHEIRTPMNGVLGFSELLDNPELSDEKRKRFIEIIRSSANQLLHIIDDIMEISVLETKQIKAEENPVCLNDLLHELFAIFNIKAIKNKITLVLKNGLSEHESTILTDKNKLNKVLNNLMENAIKFTTEGTVELGYKLKDKEIEIFVKDNGIGIKPESQKIIFERFSQAEKELSKKVGGLGLGLSIAKENAELLGGKISLISKIGEGASFYVTLPYKPVNLVPKIEKEEKKAIESKEKYTILVVEDEEVNFMVIEILLEDKIKFPCTIIRAKDGMEAIELCKNNAEIELVLMDIKMSKMDGYEATRKIKEFRPNLPIIAQTAYSSPEEKEKAFLAGCDDFISKPISKGVLNSKLKTYLLVGENNHIGLDY